MAATQSQIDRVRRMTCADEATYTDAAIAEYIEQYPLLDADGHESDDADWTATYDLNRAASVIWAEKASALAGQYDVTTDGATLARSQAYTHALGQSRYYGARAAAFTIEGQRIV